MEGLKSHQRSITAHKSEQVKEEPDEQVTQMDDAGGGDSGGVGGGDEDRLPDNSIEAVDGNGAKIEILGTDTSAPAAECDLRFNSGQQLSEVPVEYSLSPFEAAVGIKDNNYQNHQQTLDRIPRQAAHLENEGQLQSLDDPSSPEMSPTSVTQSISSISSPTQRNLSSVESSVPASTLETEKQYPLNIKPLSAVPVPKKPSPDGYNWRKYGQKQVKSPQGSRSYYRCTYSECYAKKIECSDHTNRVIDIVYKSQHNHDPPNKASCSPEIKPVPVNGHGRTENSVTALDNSVPSTSLKDSVQQTASDSFTKEQRSAGSDENSEINVNDQDPDEPEDRKRLKKSSSDCSGSLSKPGKKPKFIVHAAGDVGISGDGYRWRKYGQKMVKGNPQPRNYYRCTSAGCPVRKHIERAVDNTNDVVITYKGVHDHDMPVPKKRQGLPSPPLIAAAAPASMSNLQVLRCEQLQKETSTTKWSVDKEGELTSDTSEHGRKTTDSARTLVSIGFEIKPC